MRTVAFALALCMAVGLAGCGTSAAPPAATPTAIPTAHAAATTTPANISPQASSAAKPARKKPRELPDVAAIVNGELVPSWEFRALLELNQENSGLAGAPPTSVAAAAVRARTARQIVNEALLNAYAGTHHQAVAPAEVDARLQAFRLQSGAGFAASLARLGVTEAQFRRMVARNLNAQAVTQRIVDGIAAPPVRVQVIQIVVASRARARSVRAELLRGMDAVLVAARESSDPAMRRLAGQLPPLTRAEGNALYGPSWGATAFALRPGAVGEPVRLRDGWAIVQVIERQPASALMAQALDRFLARLRRTARITTYVR